MVHHQRNPSQMTSPAVTPPRTSCLHIFFLLIFIAAFFPSFFFTSLFGVFHPSHLFRLFHSPASNNHHTTTQTTLEPCQAPTQLPPSHHCPTMSWFQKSFTLPSRSRGSYLITDHVVSELPELRGYKTGLLNLFVQHTSCALSLNENWDEDVREDMSDALDRIAPEDRKGNLYRHSAEGSDDMPVRYNINAEDNR